MVQYSDKEDWGPRPFRFINAWLDRKGHILMMKNAWLQIGVDQQQSNIVLNLRGLCDVLQVWNQAEYSDLDQRIVTVGKHIEELDMRAEILSSQEVQPKREKSVLL
ncbi:hypothetical protein V6N13_040142 [Hibiscus sabdariffa]|uniref:Uncharacterized protein n=1 Tax=Hibiscus sabdariffa TaxID=183260 RepID=A0ABR2ST98_9ROSI